MNDRLDDWAALERYRRDGSHDAFASIVRRHMGLVYHACRRKLGDVHLAEDAAQATFLLLARRGPVDSTRQSIAGWLYRTAQNACANTMRERARRSRRERTVARHEVTPGETGIADDVLEYALAALPPSDRDVILMRYYEDMDLADVAHRLSVSSNTAAKRLSRAVSRLRNFLDQRGVRVPAHSVAPALIAAFKAPAAEEQIVKVSSGAASAATESIAKGVTLMLVHAKAKLIAATAACAVFCGGVVSVAMLQGKPSSNVPATQPARQVAPATSPAAAPAAALEPKQVLAEFTAAFRRGDGDRVVALTIPKTDDERHLMNLAGALSAACFDMKQTIAEKFGADAAREFVTMYELTPIGRFVLIIETTLPNTQEEIDGDVARIQPDNQPDLTLYLEKHDGEWKLAAGRITADWTADQWRDRLEQVEQSVDAVRQFTSDIANGKYVTFAEVRRDIAPILRQNR